MDKENKRKRGPKEVLTETAQKKCFFLKCYKKS